MSGTMSCRLNVVAALLWPAIERIVGQHHAEHQGGSILPGPLRTSGTHQPYI